MGSLILLLPLVLLAWLFWTQRRRQQQMRQAQAALTVGSEVSTTSGLLGTLVAIEEETGTIEAAPGVQLRFDRRAIVPRPPVSAAASGATEATPVAQTDLTKHTTESASQPGATQAPVGNTSETKAD